MTARRWNDYGSYLMRTYGRRVYRIGIDGGFSCPNRAPDGTGGCAYCDDTGARAAYQRTEERAFSAFPAFRPDIAAQVGNGGRKTLEERCDSVRTQIERGREFLTRRYKADCFSAYFQARTNTFAPVPVLRKLYDCALEKGPFVELIVSTRPDCLNDDVLSLLASYRGTVRKVWVELGLQSADDAVLRTIGRGHTVEAYRKAVEALRLRRIGVCTHVILGLPGERETYVETLAGVINEAGGEAVKIHNLDVCAKTELYDRYLDGEISVPAVRRHTENCIRLLRNLRSGIVVERLICETPAYRLAAPRDFPDKGTFLRSLERTMEMRDVRQGI